MWFHLYDAIPKDNLSKRVRIVVDIYTCNNYFCFNFKETSFTDLLVKSRNLNAELAYINFNGMLRISLGDLNKWPEVSNPINTYFSNNDFCNKCVGHEECLKEDRYPIDEEFKYHHVRLELEYTLLDPFFDFYGICNGYESFVTMEGHYESEFHLNIPRGLKLDLDSIKFTIFGKINVDDEKPGRLPFTHSDGSIDCNKDALSNRYTLKVFDNRYEEFLNNFKHERRILLEYKTKNKRIYYLIHVFLAVVLTASIFSFFGNKADISIIILIFSLGAFYVGLLHEGFVLPYNKMIVGMIVLSTFIFLFTYIKIFVPWDFIFSSIKNLFLF
jgi:hypothetical protein